MPATAPPNLPATSAGCASSKAVKAGDVEVVVDVDGVERSAVVHVPEAVEDGRALPLVVAFHGTYSDPADLAWITGLSELAEARGFVVAYPAGLGDPTTWNARGRGDGPNDVAYVAALLDRLGEALCLDNRRTFATGFSIGAGMALLLGCRLSDRFTAVALVAAPVGPGLGDCLPPRPTPAIVFHGLLDPVLPYYGGINPVPGFEDWPPTQDVEAWASTWAGANGCNDSPDEEVVAGFVARLTWQGCLAPLVLYRVGDGGHAWPGGNGFEAFGRISRDVSASELLWSFFED